MSHNNAETETAENDNYVKLPDSREAVLWKREVGGGAERGHRDLHWDSRGEWTPGWLQPRGGSFRQLLTSKSSLISKAGEMQSPGPKPPCAL